jgi:hypothetical protein
VSIKCNGLFIGACLTSQIAYVPKFNGMFLYVVLSMHYGAAQDGWLQSEEYIKRKISRSNSSHLMHAQPEKNEDQIVLSLNGMLLCHEIKMDACMHAR